MATSGCMHSTRELAGELRSEAGDFYQEVLELLQREELPFLVGGAFALTSYTGVCRYTKDLDLFVRQSDVRQMLRVAQEAGYEVEMTSELWIAKILWQGESIDLIFNSGNGVCPVDDLWMERGVEHEVLGVKTKLLPVEEFLWTKAFIMERERFDGADVIHTLHARAKDMDWERMLELFGEHWRVLFSHLVLFGYVYPGERDSIPGEILLRLLTKWVDEEVADLEVGRLCRGPMLSRSQYRVDTEEWGYEDARVMPHGTMTEEQALRMSRTEEENRALDEENRIFDEENLVPGRESLNGETGPLDGRHLIH